MEGMLGGRVTAPALRVARSPGQVRRLAVDHWVVALAQGAVAHLEGQVSASVPAGRPYVLSMSQALISAPPADTHLHIYFARDSFRALAPALDLACGRAIQGPRGQMLADYMRLVSEYVPRLSDDDAPRLAIAVEAMFAACLQPTADRMASAAHQIELTRRERVRRVVRRHLRDPRLDPALLCRTVAMSRSQLYRLFDGEGGVSHWIQRERLREAHARLCDPEERRTIAAIAEELCFPDASGFSRAFRRAFGTNARDVRAAAQAGGAPPSGRGRPRPPGEGFAKLVRHI